ncbi:hypothetical protein SUGI_1000600 [Cryptomeria japonica]|nr:hypothetical protein SUGI_1000600 [Cryptomeria japonica]
MSVSREEESPDLYPRSTHRNRWLLVSSPIARSVICSLEKTPKLSKEAAHNHVGLSRDGGKRRSLTVQSIAQSGDEEATQDDSSEKEPIGVSTRDAKNVRRCEDSEFEPLEENMVTNCFSRMMSRGTLMLAEFSAVGGNVSSSFVGRMWSLLFVESPCFPHFQGQWNHLPLCGHQHLWQTSPTPSPADMKDVLNKANLQVPKSSAHEEGR